MIIKALVDLYGNLLREGKVSEEGWCDAKVSYAIDLSHAGEVLGITSLKMEEERGKKKVLIPSLIKVPDMVTRSSGVSANFLCDNSKYMLGIDKNGTESRTKECFDSAKEKHQSILKDLDGDIAKAVYLFFESWDPEKAAENEEIKEAWDDITDGGNIIFSVDGIYAQEDSEVKEAWNRYRASQEDGVYSACMVTGEQCRISRLHKAIKGVAGAQSSGAPLISFNAPAFESYGKEQSYNAPVGKYAEFAYTTALNYLLSQRKYVFQIGDTTIVFWAESAEPEYQDFFSVALDTKDNQEEIRDFLDNLISYKAVNADGFKLDPAQSFCILGLAPNAARLSVRFFYQDSFGNIISNISKHYARMDIVRPSWEKRDHIGVWAILKEIKNQNAKDDSQISAMASLLLRSIISGGRYPASLYTDTIIRIRAEQGRVTWVRAAVIKAYMIRNHNIEGGEKYMGLDIENKAPAYLLGRLFSILESIQKDANPDINTTIRDRYFNSACASPASVFPILIKLKNSHLKKLEREKASSKRYYESTLTEIMNKLESFPARLSLEEQGMFILGYYHQTQKRYEKKEDK